MKRMKKNLSLVLVLALLIGMFGNVVVASAASAWSFKTKSGLTIEVNETINMQKNEFQDFNLYKSGSEITQKDSRYTVTWSSSDKDVVWVDASNGKARADKFGKLSDEYAEATVTAKIKNKTTGAVAYRRFKVSVGTPEPESPTVDHIALRFKDGTDPAQALKLNQTYTLETLIYDTEDGLITAEEASLSLKYFCDKTGVTISGSTIKPTKAGEYTITVGAFKTAEEAQSATSASKALFKAELKNLVVEDNKPKISEIRQVDLYTVSLTFSKQEIAKAIAENNSLLTVTYNIAGSTFTESFSEIIQDEENPSTITVTLFGGLTEGVTYSFTYKGTETVSASVTGSGTKPAKLVLTSEQVEIEREHEIKVKILNDKGVDITAVSNYAVTFESLDSALQYILEGNTLYFFETGQKAVIKATLDLGYDINGNPVAPLTATGQFTSIPKSKPVVGGCNGFAIASSTATAETLKYTTGIKTVCVGDDALGLYVYATFPYTDEYRETTTHYIANGRDIVDGTAYYYRSSNPNILSVDSITGMLYPFAQGSASIYIQDENNRTIGVLPITVAAERAITSLSLTNQSATKMSVDGIASDDEYITIKIVAKDQLGEKVDANYSFSIKDNSGDDFSSLFNYTFEDNVLKIWEGSMLSSVVTAQNSMRRFTIAVEAEHNGKTLPAQTFYFSVKNVTNSTATSPKLSVSSTNIDLKLTKDSISAYDTTIQVIVTDASGFYIRREPLQLIYSASAADTTSGKYSVMIQYNNKSADDYITIEQSADGEKITLKPITTSGGNEITKAKTGTYTVKLWKGNGVKAQPLTPVNIVISDSTPALTVSIKDKTPSATTPEGIKNALTFMRGTTDISDSVEIATMNSRQVNDIFQVSQLVLHVKASELNKDWTSDLDYTKITLNGLNLQFKVDN